MGEPVLGEPLQALDAPAIRGDGGGKGANGRIAGVRGIEAAAPVAEFGVAAPAEEAAAEAPAEA